VVLFSGDDKGIHLAVAGGLGSVGGVAGCFVRSVSRLISERGETGDDIAKMLFSEIGKELRRITAPRLGHSGDVHREAGGRKFGKNDEGIRPDWAALMGKRIDAREVGEPVFPRDIGLKSKNSHTV